MKKNFEQYQLFITEQKNWFKQNLESEFAQSWDDNVWVCGSKASGWLRGNGKCSLRFDEICRSKGIEGSHAIDEVYRQFMKSMLVLVYRGRSRSISPAVAMATLMILKRWYHALVEVTGQNHPIYLTTGVIRRAMDILSSASSPGDPNTANYKGRCVKLQKLVNHQAFTLVTLQYISDNQYTNQTNLTRKAKETIALKCQEKLDDTATNEEDVLITIRGFLNIVSLIHRVESDAEKIALNCLLLLVITGFRSVEAFNLRMDALVKRRIDDPTIRRRFKGKGLPDYFLGIRYVGVKGAGERTHWVEPLAIPLVEKIFETVKTLTEPLRNHLTYLREKAFVDYLPQPISDLPGELIELDEIVEHIAQSSSQCRGRAGRREKANKALTKRGIPSKKEVLGQGNSKSIYFTKTDISRFIKNEFDIRGTNSPCTHAWKENGKYYEVNYEDLLFLHTKGTLALRRTLALVATPIPLDNNLMNKFLGNVDSDGSVFSKYQLLEDDGTPTRLRTHIPRHNINTFLAIAEVSDHLQAMLMGRMDITQNHHYQHLALAERRKVASLIPLQSEINHHSLKTVPPVNMVKQTRSMVFTDKLGLETNIKANLHTFDNRDDVAEFIEASFETNLFGDIAAAFDEILKNDGPQQASEMVERHAILNPLKYGSCMRDITLWGCPYRLKCQSMRQCEHFTLTGRIDELPNIMAKKQTLEKARLQLAHTSGYHSTLANIDSCLQHLECVHKELLERAKSQRVLAAENVLSGDIKTVGEIKTLAQLFALEHHMIKENN